CTGRAAPGGHAEKVRNPSISSENRSDRLHRAGRCERAGTNCLTAPPPLRTVIPMARVLLVEDDPLLRDTLRIALQNAGHTVADAPNGSAGLLYLKDFSFDVIVTDILMPETDGLEMIMRARKESANVR